MLMYMPYVIGFLVLVGILILVLCHKPLWKVAKAGLIIVGCGIVLALTIIVSGNLITFDTLSDAMLFLNGTSALLECEGEKSAIVIPSMSITNNSVELYEFIKNKDKWKIGDGFAPMQYSQTSLLSPEYGINFFSIEDDDGTYIYIHWFASLDSVKTLSDSIGSNFPIAEVGSIGISLIYVPEITNDYVLYINEQPVDLNSLKDQLGEKDTSKLGEILLFSLAAMAFFAIIGGIIAYSVWLRKRRQPRGLRR